MKKIVLVALVSLVKLVNAQWSYLGLSGTQVTDLTIYCDTIYSSTYDGIYKKYVLSADTAWSVCGMQGNHVVQTLVPNYQTFICVVEIDSTKTTQIYKSTNGGNSFSLMNSSVSNFAIYQYLDHIAHPEGNYDTLYFSNHQLKTFDGGTTWNSINNTLLEDRFIKVNPENHTQLFIGGETGYFNAYLQTSFDYGNTWTMLPNMYSYFPGDNSVHDLVINGNDWVAVGEGVIGITSDDGNSWNQLLNTWSYPAQWGLYIYDIEFSPVDKNKIYATGDGHETYKVPLLYSADYGITWDTLSYNSTIKPRILSLAIKNTASGDKVFLGGKGVYKYENNFTGIINDNPVEPNYYYLSHNYPNPFNPSTTIEISLPKQSHVTLKIYDILGRVVTTLINKDFLPGTHKIQWNAQGYASGIYYYRIEAGKYSDTKKLLLVK